MSAALLALLSNECQLPEAAALATMEVLLLAFGDPQHAALPRGVRDVPQLQDMVARLNLINVIYTTPADSGTAAYQEPLTALQQAQMLVLLHPEKHSTTSVTNFLKHDDLHVLLRTMPSKKIHTRSTKDAIAKQTVHVSTGLHKAELLLKRIADRHAKDAALLTDASSIQTQVKDQLLKQLNAASYDMDACSVLEDTIPRDVDLDHVIKTVLRACHVPPASADSIEKDNGISVTGDGSDGNDGNNDNKGGTTDDVTVMLASLTSKEQASAAKRRLLTGKLYAIKDGICRLPDEEEVYAPVENVALPLSPSSSSSAAGPSSLAALRTDAGTAAGNATDTGTGLANDDKAIGKPTSTGGSSLSESLLDNMGYSSTELAKQRGAFDALAERVKQRMHSILRTHENELESIQSVTKHRRNKKIQDFISSRKEAERTHGDRISSTIEDSLVELVHNCQITRQKFRPIFKTAKEEVIKQYDSVRDTVYGDKQFDLVLAEREEKLWQLEKELIENGFATPETTPNGSPSTTSNANSNTNAKRNAKSKRMSKTELAIKSALVGVEAGIGSSSLLLSAKIRSQMEQQQALALAAENGTDYSSASTSMGEKKSSGKSVSSDSKDSQAATAPPIKPEDLALPWWIVVDNELQELHQGLESESYTAQTEIFRKASKEIIDYADARLEKVFVDNSTTVEVVAAIDVVDAVDADDDDDKI